jgi:hypothetical protein
MSSVVSLLNARIGANFGPLMITGALRNGMAGFLLKCRSLAPPEHAGINSYPQPAAKRSKPLHPHYIFDCQLAVPKR